ncbi:MAG TPA: ABC transporter permease [Gammaproteobacteria bacterium]|nr:ABC transporter permease [Gammaproteobacteria bacterium]
MKCIEHAKEGLRNLYFFKLRSLLALLGVLVGTASVVAMVLGGALATNEALQQFKSLGTDLLAVTINPGNDEKLETIGKVESLTLSQSLNLLHANPSIQQIAPYVQLYQPMSYEGNSINGMILGVTDSFATIAKVKLSAGRFVSLIDKYQFFCVIGREIYESMKKISFKEPLGQQIQIDKNIFIIIGIADHWPENNFLYADINRSILIPIMAAMTMSKYVTINNIVMQLTPDSDISKIEDAITKNINQLLLEKQIIFRSAKELIARMQKQSEILTVFLGLIGSISLIVGGIGVMNIMLVSVAERRREIGIRLAVGANRTDIGALFLMEAIMLSLVGGLLGVLIGILIAYIISLFWHWQFTLFILPPLVGFIVSVAVGIFFGFYPAYLASRLHPIDALRSD